MPYKILFCILLLCSSAVASAQCTIKGKITDKTGKPIAGTIISLLGIKDTALVKTAIADKEGRYTITADATLPLLLRAEKARFATQVKTIAAADTLINLVLQPAKALDEVIITSRKKLIEEKADRTVFNVEHSVVAFGGDALEAIKKMPGVQVMQQQVNITGNSGVSIMVNGRLQQLAGDELIQFLRSMPANNLSKIELITSPGAKYDAAGNTGIINLVTKKNTMDGLNGSVSANYNRNHFNSPSGSLSLRYRKGKLNLYTNDNISTWNWLYTNEAKFYYNDGTWQQVLRNEYSNKNGRAQIGTDYELNSKMTIGLVYTRAFGGNNGKEHISSSQYTGAEAADSLIRSDGTLKEVYKGKQSVNANYEWRIDSMGKKLSFSADYFSQLTERERNFTVSNFENDGTLPVNATQNRITENPAITIRSANADVELPYPNIQYSLGGKISVVDNEGQYIYEVMTPAGLMADSSRSNHFLYKEEIQAGYLSAKKKMRQLELQTGVRVERTLATGLTPSGKQLLHRDYTQLFPSANISYKVNEHHTLVLNYTRRIERPGYNLLNPFRVYYTGNSYQQGNPALQPAISNGVRLSWSVNAQYHLRLRINQVSNYWDRIYFTDSAAGVSVVSRANLGRAVIYVVNFSFSETMAPWWDLNGEISATYNRFWLDAYGSTSTYSGYSAWIELNNNFYLNKKKTLLAELNGYYYSPRQKDYKLWRSMHNLNGGIKALFLDKTLSVGVAFDDPFAASRWYQTNKGNGTTEYSYDDERSISCSLSYKFGNRNLKTKRERSETIEEIQRAR